MLTRSFIFAKGMTEDLERSLWARGVISWDILRSQVGEAAEALGNAKAQKLVESVNEATAALERGDGAWFKANWPERETWRLWEGFCAPDQAALVDIETTGLTPGYDQITVIGLADRNRSRAYVAGRPQPEDETITKFPEAMRPYRLLVTFNGVNFDAPFIEKHFREQNFRFDLPHLDLLYPARSLGLSGGLKDMEKALGIARAEDIKEMRGNEAITLWGAWRNGDLAAYKKLVTYCKADCVNLAAFADAVYRRKWEQVYTPHAREVDFAKVNGEQMTLF